MACPQSKVRPNTHHKSFEKAKEDHASVIMVKKDEPGVENKNKPAK